MLFRNRQGKIAKQYPALSYGFVFILASMSSVHSVFCFVFCVKTKNEEEVFYQEKRERKNNLYQKNSPVWGCLLILYFLKPKKVNRRHRLPKRRYLQEAYPYVQVE